MTRTRGHLMSAAELVGRDVKLVCNGQEDGYRVANQVNVTIHQIAQVGDILDRLVKAGATERRQHNVSGFRS